MHPSPVKSLLALLSFLLLSTFCTANPLPAPTTPNPLNRRQLSSVFTGNLCDTHFARGPDQCFFIISSKHINIDEGEWMNWSSLYIFRNTCELIGYIPEVNLDGTWVSVDSQLRWTVDAITFGFVPEFNYAGRHYDTHGGNWFMQWEENDSGIDVYNWRFLFSC
jgi:photosystem II stability/assembly factor-like uncharacterized protein